MANWLPQNLASTVVSHLLDSQYADAASVSCLHRLRVRVNTPGVREPFDRRGGRNGPHKTAYVHPISVAGAHVPRRRACRYPESNDFASSCSPLLLELLRKCS